MRHTTRDPRDEQLLMLQATIRTYRQRCASLERVVVRLTAVSPCREHEIEIARLEARCLDLEARWEEAEGEAYNLRKLLLQKAG